MSAIALSCLLTTLLGAGQSDSLPEILITKNKKDALAWRRGLPNLAPVDLANLQRASEWESLPALRVRLTKENVDVVIDRECWASEFLYRELLFSESAKQHFKTAGFEPMVINAETGGLLFKRAFRVITSTMPTVPDEPESNPGGELLISPAIGGFLVIDGKEKSIVGSLRLQTDGHDYSMAPVQDAPGDVILSGDFRGTNLAEAHRSLVALRHAGEAWKQVYRRLADLAENPLLYGGAPLPKLPTVPFRTLATWKQKALIGTARESWRRLGFLSPDDVEKTLKQAAFRQSYFGASISATVPSRFGSPSTTGVTLMISRRD